MTNNEPATGPFAEVALMLRDRGLAPVPCIADDDGKKPAIAWGRWRQRPGLGAYTGLVRRFPWANVGIATGLSNVTIVDIDDLELVPRMLQRFGDTPLITETPSGGRHLWFRSSGERSANLRFREGLAVDIKAMGGFVVTPPSVRPSGPAAGRRYVFRTGSWDDICHLPTLRAGSLPSDRIALRSRSHPIQVGCRNDTIFNQLLRHAPACDNLGALKDVAEGLNEECEPSLSESELTKIATSVWRIQSENRNFVGQEPRVLFTKSEINAFMSYPRGPDALMLLAVFREYHFDRPEFAASPVGMADSKLILGWAHGRYRLALKLLLELGLLAIVHSGGRGRHDPRLFRLSNGQIDQERT